MDPKKRIAFIEPATFSGNVFENYMHLPLMGTLYLGTILHNAGYHVEIYNENIIGAPIDPYTIKADVYCISALTVSSNRAKLIAQEIKKIYPKAKVIIGGIHASLCPETFYGIADHIVYGESESIIVDLIEGKFTNVIIQGTPIEDLDSLPLVNYDLLQGHTSMDVIPIMTSRGCPFDCNFCTVTKIFGKRFRMQSPERIIREIRHAITFFKTRSIFFYDDNFTANRKRVDEFCDLLQNEPFKIQWVTQVRSDIANDPQLLEKMSKAGCHFFFIGFESINNETLKAMHKSQTQDDIIRAIEVIRSKGINIHGMFIFGDDHDTPESIQATVDFAVAHHIDTVQFMILTPFPGTQYFNEINYNNRLLHNRWDYYNAMFAVIRPASMSASRLQQETIKAYSRFYSIRRLMLDALRLVIDISIDALTWNFNRAFNYSFEIIFLKAGARFIVGRYAKSVNPYMEFLKKLEENTVLQVN